MYKYTHVIMLCTYMESLPWCETRMMMYATAWYKGPSIQHGISFSQGDSGILKPPVPDQYPSTVTYGPA